MIAAYHLETRDNGARSFPGNTTLRCKVHGVDECFCVPAPCGIGIAIPTKQYRESSLPLIWTNPCLAQAFRGMTSSPCRKGNQARGQTFYWTVPFGFPRGGGITVSIAEQSRSDSFPYSSFSATCFHGFNRSHTTFAEGFLPLPACHRTYTHLSSQTQARAGMGQLLRRFQCFLWKRLTLSKPGATYFQFIANVPSQSFAANLQEFALRNAERWDLVCSIVEVTLPEGLTGGVYSRSLYSGITDRKCFAVCVLHSYLSVWCASHHKQGHPSEKEQLPLKDPGSSEFEGGDGSRGSDGVSSGSSKSADFVTPAGFPLGEAEHFPGAEAGQQVGRCSCLSYTPVAIQRGLHTTALYYAPLTRRGRSFFHHEWVAFPCFLFL